MSTNTLFCSTETPGERVVVISITFGVDTSMFILPSEESKTLTLFETNGEPEVPTITYSVVSCGKFDKLYQLTKLELILPNCVFV